MPTKSNLTFCLWGWRRGNYSYAFLPRMAAINGREPIIGCQSFSRDVVTVARRTA